ncbi:DNA helicase [Tanacetum coccineum]
MPYRLFGGKSVLLGGDFRQTLLVKKGASKMEIIESCISQSNLRLHFKVFTLTKNMRLSRPGVSADKRSLITSFASWLLDIRDGKIGEAELCTVKLKVGAPVMLLRNVNVAGGLCNGTRMIVRQMMIKLIEAVSDKALLCDDNQQESGTVSV